jgi:hypothetical protein
MHIKLETIKCVFGIANQTLAELYAGVSDTYSADEFILYSYKGVHQACTKFTCHGTMVQVIEVLEKS